MSIAVSTPGASAANVVIKRETVGSEGTFPNTAACSRSVAMSARQSPPSASDTARSRMILPGANCANGLRHGESCSDRAMVSPVTSAVRSKVTAPACDTTPVPVASTDRAGYDDVDFLTRMVLLDVGEFQLW